MEISWQGVIVASAGFAAAVAIYLYGGEGGDAIALAIVTGILGMLIPHPVRRVEYEEEEEEEE